MIELKFKERSAMKNAGIRALLVAILWTVILVIGLFATGGVMLVMSPIFLIVIFLFFKTGMYYLKSHKINYLEFNKESISIHKGAIRKRKLINWCDIEEGRLLEKKLVFILNNGDEVEISLEVLKIKDKELLIRELENRIIIK